MNITSEQERFLNLLPRGRWIWEWDIDATLELVAEQCVKLRWAQYAYVGGKWRYRITAAGLEAIKKTDERQPAS